MYTEYKSETRMLERPITSKIGCAADYLTDKKWHKYLDKCCRFYICITQELWDSKTGYTIEKEAKASGAGVMVLNDKTGYMMVRVKARKREILEQTVLRLALKMVWRYGRNRSNTRRTKQFIR